MKSVVHFFSSANLHRPLCVLAACAGFASYVTLVSSLTQKIEAEKAARAQALASENQQRVNSLNLSLRSQQTSFVTKIIELHAPKREDSRELAELIVEESTRAGLDPLFVAAVIRSESMFRHRAVSSRGAKGLMQLMPATGRYISKREKIELRRIEDLKDPATNLRLGIAYLKYLNKKFKGHQEHVLIAYNWGPGNVLQSLERNATPPSGPLVYARTILSAHSEWASQLSAQVINTTDMMSGTLLG